MNPHDRENVNFIMSLSTSEFDAWAEELTTDDLSYAMEILRQARMDMLEQEDALINAQAEEDNYAEARDVLKKFML